MIDWFKARVEDRQLMILLMAILVVVLFFTLFGELLIPILVAGALAYVLDGMVTILMRIAMPRWLAVAMICLVALMTILLALFAMLPSLTDQVGRLIAKVPLYVQDARIALQHFQSSEYANWFDAAQLQQLIAAVATKIQSFGAAILSYSLNSIPSVMTFLVYVVLVPVLVFFQLKDKPLMIAWVEHFLPEDRVLLNRVWSEFHAQVGNYIRGRFWESLMVGVVTGVVFFAMHHDYALLLATLTGLSVWIPFVGAAVVTVPVVLLSFFQWGWSETTMYALLAYGIIQLIDANVVIPWLFSEVVNLHPVAIIAAILIFGGFWGVLGVFVAIPLAALVQSIFLVIVERCAVSGEAASPNKD
ncbi:MAG: AI-2E family transporter [Zetaproteobacteria bacterium]|nr:AI-2E family transporter [Zetaproteobacteria bacterium]